MNRVLLIKIRRKINRSSKCKHSNTTTTATTAANISERKECESQNWECDEWLIYWLWLKLMWRAIWNLSSLRLSYSFVIYVAINLSYSSISDFVTLIECDNLTICSPLEETCQITKVQFIEIQVRMVYEIVHNATVSHVRIWTVKWVTSQPKIEMKTANNGIKHFDFIAWIPPAEFTLYTFSTDGCDFERP